MTPFQILEEQVAGCVEVYLAELTGRLIGPRLTSAQQSAVLGGIAAGLRRYEVSTGRPVIDTLIAELIDQKEVA